MFPTQAEVEASLEKIYRDMELWIVGTYSWQNLGPYEPYTPDVIARMDAAEIEKRANAIKGYTEMWRFLHHE